MTDTKPLIMLTAGGTGGHVYPADALAEELLKRNYRVALVTDSRGKNNYKGKLGEIPNYAVQAGALVGKSKWFKTKSLIKTGFGILQAIIILLKNKPTCVVGFGGYASFPCCMAAIILRIPLVIHEQNAVMSRTNRMLSKYSSLIAQSFKKVKFTPRNVKTILTGMPIREAIIKAREIPYPSYNEDDKFQIFVLGGSQGAKIFGEIIPSVIKTFNKDFQKRIKLIQQCREVDTKDIQKNLSGLETEVVLSHFFNNMPELYSSSHLIISRAGASSVCEILAVGRPSILVPLPIAADDHQTYNAQDVKEAAAGYVINQQDFTIENISSLILGLSNKYNELLSMSDNAKKAGITDAAERFANAIEQEIINKTGK